MKEVYLDNSATTKVFPEVVELMSKIMLEDYGNPSSMHQKGVEAEKYLKEAKETFAKALKVSEKEIFFTSCGSESDNMAIIGGAHANRRNKNHIITTKIEHPAVLNSMKYLEEEGFEVTYLNVDRNGIVSLDELKAALRKDTLLVSMMQVNNEIGSINPVAEAGKIIKEFDPSILFHVDAVQSFGKVPVFPKKDNIDLLSISGHKIHASKGVAVLYVSEKVRVNPIILGGGQQGGKRSGTENVPGIAGMALAARMLMKDFNSEVERLYDLKKYFIDEVTKIEGVTVNGVTDEIPGAPHIISVSVRDVRSEVLLHSLESKGVYISAGSACSSHKRTPSATLTAIGLEPVLLESTVRFSMSVNTTKEDIDIAIETMSEFIPMLRKYTRR